VPNTTEQKNGTEKQAPEADERGATYKTRRGCQSPPRSRPQDVAFFLQYGWDFSAIWLPGNLQSRLSKNCNLAGWDFHKDCKNNEKRKCF